MGMLFSVATVLAVIAPPQTPPGTWQWNRDTPICALRQQVYNGSAAIEVKRTPANDQTELLVTLPRGSKIGHGRFGDGKIVLQPSDTAVAGPIGLGAWSARDSRSQLAVTIYDPAFLQNLAKATKLQISESKVGSFDLPVTSAADAVDALRVCEDNKMRAWGLDPRAWRALQARPLPLGDPRNRFKADDYPQAALAQHLEDDAISRLDVSPDGVVTDCAQLNAASYRGFEQAACRVLKRARFRPARDANGRPVSAPIIYDIVFRLPY